MSIKAHAESMGLRYFLTLTLDPSKLQFNDDPQCAVPHLRRVWNKFREYLRREFGKAPTFIVVLEFTKAGVPHLHVLLDRYLAQRWISKTWDALGGGRICDVRRVRLEKISRYLSKYLTKELLLSAPKGTRRLSTSRNIKLFPKWVGQHTAQQVVKQSIWGLIAEQRITRAFTEQAQPLFGRPMVVMEADKEGYLQAFELGRAGDPLREGQICAA
jgi:hypothetical protein